MTTSQLQDRAEITDLVYRLGACLDEHRFDDLPALFTEDATAATPGGTAQGRDAVIAQATRNHAEYDRLQHQITNVLVDVDGDRAAVRANLLAALGRDAGRPALVLGAVYRFPARRTPAGWQLAGVAIEPVWRVQAESKNANAANVQC
jgi:3-phenylpropionate/cinnamic acid dioxygenase small subunit